MKCITIQEASVAIGFISPEMLYHMAKWNMIPSVRTGLQVLIDEDDIPRIINSFKVQPKQAQA